jgi:hypothetical protein
MHKFDTPGKAFDFDQLLADLLGHIGKVGNCGDHANSLRANRAIKSEQKSQDQNDLKQMAITGFHKSSPL